ncbi:MAG: restriction endonuclease [Chitinophagaceae bacterium BSSC1]|nr:MAG: restriction endonuclease [Chitinophagaceae bacterium BSSC1]
MNNKESHIISVFEHESLYVHKGEKIRLTDDQLKSLQTFYKEKDFPYYTLVHKGIRFCEYVGVLQVGNLTIEILPKADNNGLDHWRKMLIGMLRSVNSFNIHSPTNSDVLLKANSILDLYFELFINETESILHKGLIKKYRKIEGNQNSLKGKIVFTKQILSNISHQERFFVSYSIYDKEHPLNKVLYKVLKLLKLINRNQNLKSRINALLLNFPELPNIVTDESFFNRISYSRKTEPYKKAIEISRLLLINYHPDISKGNNNVLALMFDMNSLWEGFVLASIKRFNTQNIVIHSQKHKLFWQKSGGYAKRMIPDIVLTNVSGKTVVVDTKWKNIGEYNPSDADLRQMYTYSKFHDNANTILLYPGNETKYFSGSFYDENLNNVISNTECGILKIAVSKNIKEWQKLIFETLSSNIL